MTKESIIVFVCEHGAAKSVIAATYFNQLAKQRGLDLRGIARGTNPESQLSSSTIQGLSNDGLIPTESTPRQLSAEDIQSAQQIVSFCELSDLDRSQSNLLIERWDDVPPVSENYDKARDAILVHLDHLIDHIRSSS